ncbi:MULTISPECIES: ABC transporter permease [Gluconobacter]|uniref:ABC transporter permease n=1 Tax=Gluconobacter cerinus TaxID=38307 RepID=A0A1B6VKD1_9PROT|nr:MULTISPECIES: ABC transporter permease [Gluconobacter]MBS1019081.1 ABC transporter permease [Gluconobacter cerinus]MBS1067649.1 ABC transporter permease [Gluconobacter cerinus]MBS1072400.1 ABC transporter permease [Gluconobacter cerinus]MCW2267047.1 simple sugar transport system permease protein [Gluconobacter cerinus]OAJ67681.1 sugar ABC transporter [Gluconobacter cerinus]
MALLSDLLGHAVLSGGVLALGALGEVIAERAGVLNLGVEGLMSLGAVVAVMTVNATPHPWLGLLAAGLVGGLGASVLALSSVVLRANQVLCGVAITFLGLGLSSVIGRSVAGVPVSAVFEPVSIPVLSAIPVIGPAFFSQNILVYLIYLVFPVMAHFWLFRTRSGLDLRAVGENPAAADAVGVPVMKYRALAVIVGGVLAGVAGADLTLAVVPVWSDGMIAGRGWIAVALVIFAGYRPIVAVLSGLLFGLVTAVGFMGQARGWPVAPAILNTLPYLGTVACIIVPMLAFAKLRSAMAAPAALGTPYYRSGR